VQAEASRLADTAHLEFKGIKTWRYDLGKAAGNKITLSLPPLEDRSIAKLQSFSDPLVKGITVNKQGPDGNHVITFELSQADVESFDYLTDDPSRLIVDFYRKSEPAKPPTDPKSAPVKTAPTKQAVSKPNKVKTADGEYEVVGTNRKPAGDEFLTGATNAPAEKAPPMSLRSGLFDGADDNYDRFRIKDYEIREESIIASRNNVYLPFPMLKMKVSQLGDLLENRPELVINPKDTKENKEARLLLALYERKRFGVFRKTYDYFMKKYPESEYAEILKNLSASVYLTKWREENSAPDFDSARALYHELVHKYPDSPLREYNYLILGFAQMERGDALATLQTFQGFIEEYPRSQEVPQVRKGIAEAFMILRRNQEAIEQLNGIIKDFPKTAHAFEARYRLGDVHFAMRDYSGAINQYESAIKELPSQEKVFPNADFNMAESRFAQKDYKKALSNYIQFVNLFPNHEWGGYALTRIGELLNLLGADPRRVMGAYLEAYFRFPKHPGAKVARLRMLSAQVRSMKEKELKKAIEEINKTAEQLDLPEIKEFTTLMVADTFTQRGEYRDAIGDLVSYYQKNPTTPNSPAFRSRILRNISNEMKSLVDSGDFMKTLSFHSQFEKTWLMGSDRIDVPYSLAGAYELAGAYDEARAIYSDILEHRKRIVGTEEEKTRKVQEHLPSTASIHLRLASSLTADRNYVAAYQHLKNMGNAQELSPKEQVERVQLSAQIAEQRNEPDRAREALLDLAKKWQGDPALLAPVNLKLAETFTKLKDPKQAEFYADRVLQAESGETPIEDKLIARAFEVKGEAQLAQERALAAIESYQKLLERYEGKMALGNVRYKIGTILYERGDLKGARDVWKRLEGTPNDLLWKLGKERLEDTKWRDDYNKYISRIPAMSASGAKGAKP
jgi:tetratricopeptide (TPR) repeat protein